MSNRRKIGRAAPGVERPAAIAVLAAPLSQEIVDTIAALGGEAAASEIAAQLGRPADGLYYHLRLQVAAGLLEELRGRSASGRAERRYRIRGPRGEPLRLVYRPDDRRNAREVGRVVAGMLRIARRDFAAGFSDREAVVDGPRRNLWASRGKGWVSAADVIELNRLLARVNALMQRRRTRTRDRLVSLCFVLAPVRAQPARRGGRATGRRRSRTDPSTRTRRGAGHR